MPRNKDSDYFYLSDLVIGHTKKCSRDFRKFEINTKIRNPKWATFKHNIQSHEK